MGLWPLGKAFQMADMEVQGRASDEWLDVVGDSVAVFSLASWVLSIQASLKPPTSETKEERKLFPVLHQVLASEVMGNDCESLSAARALPL
ncbi:hypothetical protein MHYP_G00104670 [Metynnis hypsauchen]